MLKYKMDEFHLPPSLDFPRMDKETKRAWEDDMPKKTDNRTFYPEFCRFALLLKTLGFFPVHLTKFSSDLHFSWRNVSTLFSFLTLPILQIVIVKTNPLDIVDQFFAYISVLLPTFSKLLYLHKLPTLIELIQLMDSIDTSHCVEKGDRKVTRKNNKFLIGLLFLSTFISFFPVHFISFGLRSVVFNKYFCANHRIIVHLMVASFFYNVCYQLCVLYDRYHASLACLEKRPCEEVTERMVEDHRLTHAQLVRCVRLLDHSFGLWLMVTYVTTSVQFIKSCYSVMYSSSGAAASSVVLLNVSWTLLYLFYPAVLTDRIYNKSKDTIHFTFRMALKPYSEDVLFQVYYFMRQVKINTAAVNAGGLADINKEIITKGLSLFATFFVAAIQLEPQMTALMNNLRDWLVEVDKLSGPGA